MLTEVFVRDVKVSDHVGKDGDETFGKFQARFGRVQKAHVQQCDPTRASFVDVQAAIFRIFCVFGVEGFNE